MKVYKIVNYRKYIILIFHIAVDFCELSQNYICVARIMPKPVHSGDDRYYFYFVFISVHADWANVLFDLYNNIYEHHCLFCFFLG